MFKIVFRSVHKLIETNAETLVQKKFSLQGERFSIVLPMTLTPRCQF